MKSVSASVKQTIVGAAAIIVLALAGPSLSSAQETTTTETSTTTSTFSVQTLAAEKEDTATSSAVEVCEAQQRTEARWQNWIKKGIPEEFGSEEPFKFNPNKC